MPGGGNHPALMIREGIGRVLVAPRRLAALTLARSQVAGASSTGLNALGIAWAEYPADVARFLGIAGRLGVEGARTNGVRNSRAEGSPPTHWSLVQNGGLTTTFIGSSVVSGINVATYEVTGTPSSTSGSLLIFDAAIAAAASEVWTGAVFFGLDPLFANDTSGVSFSLRLVSATDTGGTTFTPTTAPLTEQRVLSTRTMDVGTTLVQPRLRFGASVGVPVSFRILVGWPQCELGGFASSPVLPAVGTPAASTRGADQISATLASLGLSDSGAGTYFGTFVATGQSTLNMTLIQLDNNGAANRYFVRQAANTLNVFLFRVTASAATSVLLGTVTAGVPFRVGMAVDGAGRVVGSLDGAAVGVLTGGPTSGLLSIRIGAAFGGSDQLFGDVGVLRSLPRGVADDVLPRLVAALPISG